MTRIVKPSSCENCIGHDWTRDLTGWINPEGHGTSGLMIVGEAGGKTEGNDGLPFRPYAVSGSLLERAFREWGTSRSQHRITNILHCSPPRDWLADAPYEFDVIQHCRPNLDREIESMKPKCILALGAIALRELTGMSGKYRGISYLRGYAIPLLKEVRVKVAPHNCCGEGCFTCDGHGTVSRHLPTNIPVISSFHPSFIRRGSEGESSDMEGKKGNMRLFGVLLHDLKVAMEIARIGVKPATSTKYQQHPSLQDKYDFRRRVIDNPNLTLAYDIETPNSAEMDEDERDEDTSQVITQIQFSLGIGEGIVFNGSPEDMDIARDIIALPNPKVGHNVWLFDDPKMRANGFKFGGPLADDTMVMWHNMQPDLPANLQFVASFYQMDRPWKHLGETDMAEYGCCDVDAPHRILAQLPAQLKARGIWEGYHRRTYQVRPILRRMEDRGVPINDEKRKAFGGELDAAKLEEWKKMQDWVPEECRDLHPKEGYKKEPKDKTGLVLRQFETITDIPREHRKIIMVQRWCRIEPFTPSPKQLIRYIKYRGHTVPKHFKTGKDTTAAVELDRLWKKTEDPLYRSVKVYREIQTMKGTFVEGWKPAADGRVHSTFTFKPATMQLSSRDPNVQNSPQHTGLAEKFNEVIEAPPGYTLVDFDHKSFHALTLGVLAGDEVYTRVARIDIHSFVTSEFLHLKPISTMIAMADGELAEYLGWVKKTHEHTRNYKIKRVILGWQYGRGYRAIYQAYREDFTGESESKRMVETLEGCFPKAVEYRANVLHEANDKHYLTVPFGFIRWFWDVLDFRPPKEGRAIRRCRICGLHHSNGEQAEQAIAYRPACTAFGIMRDESLDLGESQFDDRFGLINNIHDSWKFCCPDPLVEECLHTVKPIMEKPATLMAHPTLAPGGLVCEVEAKVGRSAAKMEKVKVATHATA